MAVYISHRAVNMVDARLADARSCTVTTHVASIDALAEAATYLCTTHSIKAHSDDIQLRPISLNASLGMPDCGRGHASRTRSTVGIYRISAISISLNTSSIVFCFVDFNSAWTSVQRDLQQGLRCQLEGGHGNIT